MAILRFGQPQSQWSYFQGQKIIYILSRPYFGTPCISVSPKTGIVSGTGLPLGHRYLKYVSLCWSNSYIMASALGGRNLSISHIKCLLTLILTGEVISDPN